MEAVQQNAHFKVDFKKTMNLLTDCTERRQQKTRAEEPRKRRRHFKSQRKATRPFQGRLRCSSKTTRNPLWS